jgi:hypothetical protein
VIAGSEFRGFIDIEAGAGIALAELIANRRNAEIERLEAQSDHVRQGQHLADLDLMRAAGLLSCGNSTVTNWGHWPRS